MMIIYCFLLNQTSNVFGRFAVFPDMLCVKVDFHFIEELHIKLLLDPGSKSSLLFDEQIQIGNPSGSNFQLPTIIQMGPNGSAMTDKQFNLIIPQQQQQQQHQQQQQQQQQHQQVLSNIPVNPPQSAIVEKRPVSAREQPKQPQPTQ